jgi:hypothetical protein
MNVPSVFVSRWEVLSITQMPPYPPLGKKSIGLRIWNQFYPHWNYVKWLASTGWNNSGLTNCAVEVDWAYAAAARVIRQSVWLCLAREWHKEVPRRGDFQRIPRIPKGITKGITDPTNHRALFSDSMAATYTGTSLTPCTFSVFAFWCWRSSPGIAICGKLFVNPQSRGPNPSQFWRFGDVYEWFWTMIYVWNCLPGSESRLGTKIFLLEQLQEFAFCHMWEGQN